MCGRDFAPEWQCNCSGMKNSLESGVPFSCWDWFETFWKTLEIFEVLTGNWWWNTPKLSVRESLSHEVKFKQVRVLRTTQKSKRGRAPCEACWLVAIVQHIENINGPTNNVLYGHKLWNKLPNHIRDTTSFKTFKTLLKAHLSQETYHQWLFISSVPQALYKLRLIDWLIELQTKECWTILCQNSWLYPCH